MLSIDKINALEYTTSMANCKGCTNHCRLTINTFSGGRQFISGNRCEKGLGKEKNRKKIPNLFDYKYKKLFHRAPLSPVEATRGQVGIPRVLNMYENYPFWHTFFTELKYQVILSPTCPDKGNFMRYEGNLPASSYVENDIRHLIRLRNLNWEEGKE